MNEIKLLDHGYVRLVDHMGNDLSIVRSARQSYDAAWRALLELITPVVPVTMAAYATQISN